MLINLINQLLNDEEGISAAAYNTLVSYLESTESGLADTTPILLALETQIRATNGRYYLLQDLELNNEQ
jgi:hypothetical protein